MNLKKIEGGMNRHKTHREQLFGVFRGWGGVVLWFWVGWLGVGWFVFSIY